MIRNLRCTVTIESVLANSKTSNAFLFTGEPHFSSRLTPSGGTWKYAKAPSAKKTRRDSLPIDMLLSAVSVLVVAQSSSEIPEGLMNNPVFAAQNYGNVPETATSTEVPFTDPDEIEIDNSEQLEGKIYFMTRKWKEGRVKKSSQWELKEEGKYKN